MIGAACCIFSGCLRSYLLLNLAGSVTRSARASSPSLNPVCRILPSYFPRLRPSASRRKGASLAALGHG
jgi:hypothetical protein